VPHVALAWSPGASPADPRPRARASITATLAGRTVEFHDAYWAPLVAGQTNFRSMFRWLRGRSWQPLFYLVAPWASHAQLKIDVLQEDRERLTELERELGELYARFVARSREARTKGGDSFGAFVHALAAGREPAHAAALVGVARKWRWRYVLSLVWAWLRTAPLLVAIGAAAIAVPLTAAWIAQRLIGQPPGLLETIGIAVAAILWLVSFWLARFLVRYLGDVEVYTTYNEASERFATREAVVRLATDALRRPLEDDGVERVVLVAHSLGSVVAWDAVRALALEAETAGGLAWERLLKLSRVVTFGSPVDKVRFYHFADDRNDPTFRAILEAMKVDTGYGRFGASGRGLAWDNFYDPADLIGGRLESPNDPAMRFPVRNVAVRNGEVPNPYQGHVGYLANPDVLDGILGAIEGPVRPPRSELRAYGERAWATTIELLALTGFVALFVTDQLLPLVLGASWGDPIGWIALALLIAMLGWLA
jgi:hypothetical protein